MVLRFDSWGAEQIHPSIFKSVQRRWEAQLSPSELFERYMWSILCLLYLQLLHEKIVRKNCGTIFEDKPSEKRCIYQEMDCSLFAEKSQRPVVRPEQYKSRVHIRSVSQSAWAARRTSRRLSLMPSPWIHFPPSSTRNPPSRRGRICAPSVKRTTPPTSIFDATSAAGIRLPRKRRQPRPRLRRRRSRSKKWRQFSPLSNFLSLVMIFTTVMSL